MTFDMYEIMGDELDEYRDSIDEATEGIEVEEDDLYAAEFDTFEFDRMVA